MSRARPGGRSGVVAEPFRLLLQLAGKHYGPDHNRQIDCCHYSDNRMEPLTPKAHIGRTR